MSPTSHPSFAHVAAVVGGVVLVVGAWILATPPNGGPDEISHRLRGEAVAQGSPGSAKVEAPIRLVWPDISCFALFADRPASCIATEPAPGGTGDFVTRAFDYPLWGHVTAAAAVRGSGSVATPYVERAIAAIVPAALVAAAVVLALRRRALAAALATLATTPMAWFMLAVVNPSDLVIAGALLAWVAVGVGSPPGPDAASRATDWAFAVGIAAVMLPRRDGAFWAATIVIAAALLRRRSVVGSVRALGRWPAVAIAGAVIATVVWAATANRQVQGLVALSVALVVLHDAWRWARSRCTPATRPAVDVAAIAVGVSLALVAVASRTRGLADGAVVRSVLGETLANLREAVGAAGTLDALVPWWAALAFGASIMAVWWASRGVAEAGVDRRAIVLAPVVLGVAVVSAWVLELARDDATGTYWQGRYYLPLLMGVVLLAGVPLVNRLGDDRSRAWAVALVAVAAVVATATFVVALRRWGVGTSGSWDPRSWDTYGAPGSPVLLVTAHTAGLALLAVAVLVRPGVEVRVEERGDRPGDP